ncbi:MAG: GNAT family N-acetyltransferase, partial [Anaerolineaceae bacterium]|nr:GNAT family N-acetyltransferase [Anaerolineaceae bacterium]
MDDTLFTGRLILRPLSPDDADALFAVYRDPRAMRFMPTPPHQSVAETRAGLVLDLGRQGACGWAICLKDADRALGTVTFLGETPVPGMGYLLHPDYWGSGIVPEACQAVLKYGFERLGYDRVELWI